MPDWTWASHSDIVLRMATKDSKAMRGKRFQVSVFLEYELYQLMHAKADELGMSHTKFIERLVSASVGYKAKSKAA